MASNPVISAAIVGYGLFLWLALYLLVRASLRSPLILLSVLGLFGQAAYFFAAALTDSLANQAVFVAVERWTWWASVLPLAVWFHLSTLISRSIQRPAAVQRIPASVVLAYIVAVLVSVVGSLTNLFNDYADAGLTIRAGPAYGLYMLFQLAMTVGALLNFVRARSVLQKRNGSGDQLVVHQISLLIGGSGVFILGALWLGLRYLFALPVEATVGYLLLFAGVALLGYGVAHYGLLLDGRNIQRDFFYTFSGIVLLNGVYVALLGLVASVSTAGVLALVTLVTLTHTAFDSGRSLLDRLFFSEDEQAARAEAREYATALGTEPVAMPMPEEPEAPAVADAQNEGEAVADEVSSLKNFKADVRRALTNLKNPPRLVNSPLLTLDLVETQLATNGLSDNRLNRVAALREVLVEQIEGLRPEFGDGPRVGEAWRFYNVLHYPYVRELSRKGALAEARRLRSERARNGVTTAGELEQVLDWLADVDEDTFYKWQRRASDTIAEALWEQARGELRGNREIT